MKQHSDISADLNTLNELTQVAETTNKYRYRRPTAI